MEAGLPVNEFVTQKKPELEEKSLKQKKLLEQKQKWDEWKREHIDVACVAVLSVSRQSLSWQVGTKNFNNWIRNCFALFEVKDRRGRIAKQELGQILGTTELDFDYRLTDYKYTRLAALVKFADGKELIRKFSEVSNHEPLQGDIVNWQKECFTRSTTILSKSNAHDKIKELCAEMYESTGEEKQEKHLELHELKFGNGSIGREKFRLRNNIEIAEERKNKDVLNSSVERLKALDLWTARRESNLKREEAERCKAAAARIIASCSKQGRNLGSSKGVASSQDKIGVLTKQQKSVPNNARMKQVKSSKRMSFLAEDMKQPDEKKSKSKD